MLTSGLSRAAAAWLPVGAGMAIGTVFTLFVVPALYTVIAKEHHDRIPADTAAATSALPN